MIKILTNPWLLLALAVALLSLAGGLWAYGHTKYREGYKQCVAAQAKEQAKTTNETIQIRKRQNEARNNRPDTAALVDRLRNGSF